MTKIIYAIKGYFQYRSLKQSGVVFMSGFNIFTDVKKIYAVAKDYPTTYSSLRLFEKQFGRGKIPPLIGHCFMGMPTLSVTTV